MVARSKALVEPCASIFLSVKFETPPYSVWYDPRTGPQAHEDGHNKVIGKWTFLKKRDRERKVAQKLFVTNVFKCQNCVDKRFNNVI